MSQLLARYRTTRQRQTLTDKVRAETCLATLDAMQAACGARGQELNADELQAFTLRRAELMKGRR